MPAAKVGGVVDHPEVKFVKVLVLILYDILSPDTLGLVGALAELLWKYTKLTTTLGASSP